MKRKLLCGTRGHCKVCRHVAALCPQAVRDVALSKQELMSSLSLLQISVNLKAVVAGVSNSHMSV